MRLGADPEIFLQDQQGKLISAIGLINGDKWNPFQIPDLPQGFTLQQDNVALEFGIPPAATEDEFVHHIKVVMEKGLEACQGLSFSGLSCAIFPKDQMENPLAHQFGCEPDYNAWTGRKNLRPVPPHEYMRSAGGHIHVETTLPKRLVVKAMDLFLCVPSLLMDEEGAERRQMYGKPGAYRPKSYGVEYRSLSNFWIKDEKYVRWAWRNTQRAAEEARLVQVEHWNMKTMGDIRFCIENNDKEYAKKLVKEFDLEVI